MADELARRAHAVFVEALGLDSAERERLVEDRCAGDAALHQRVRRLLGAVARSTTFLEAPALGAGHAVTLDPGPLSVRGYRLVRVIGVGGMATVYEAEQAVPRRTVALKVMNRALASTSAVDRFRYETEVLARLRHPGIAQIFEAGTCDDGSGRPLPFFAMELVPGATTIVEHARGLPLERRLAVFAGVCDAVEHGHQQGIIHRDLKPANILVDGEGRTKVIDFGVARPADPEHAGLTRVSDARQLIGTLNAMSPEQCAGDRPVDVRTDIYSLGVILYELVGGRLPHDLSRASITEAARIIAEEAPARLSSIAHAAKGDLEAIVARAMEKDPGRRYGSAGSLAADVRRFLLHQPIEARPAEPDGLSGRAGLRRGESGSRRLPSKGGRGSGRITKARRCEATTVKGELCGAAALPESAFCLFHDPERAAEREEARRAGGVERSRRMAVLPTETPETPLESVSDVTRLLGRTIWDVLKGRVDPRVANAVGYLAGTMIRGIEAAELEQRLAALEGIVTEQHVGIGSSFDRPFPEPGAAPQPGENEDPEEKNADERAEEAAEERR